MRRRTPRLRPGAGEERSLDRHPGAGLGRTAVTVRSRDGKVAVTDGPFAETKEQLGGFNLIEARDRDEAIRIASKFPWTRTGSVEIRPVLEASPIPDPAPRS